MGALGICGQGKGVLRILNSLMKYCSKLLDRRPAIILPVFDVYFSNSVVILVSSFLFILFDVGNDFPFH